MGAIETATMTVLSEKAAFGNPKPTRNNDLS